jgi:hypothetical protein
MMAGALSRNSCAAMHQENIGSGRAEKGDKCHANRYIAAASGFFDCGNTDFHFPETIKLYRCHLSYCHRHSRISPMIDLQESGRKKLRGDSLK